MALVLIIYMQNVLIMKLYFKESMYITFVIHIDGKIECIIDNNIIYEDIQNIIKLCNDYIKKINTIY